MTPRENFRASFNDATTRENFKQDTGLDAKGNITAFISYLNELHTLLLIERLHTLSKKIKM